MRKVQEFTFGMCLTVHETVQPLLQEKLRVIPLQAILKI